MTKDQDLQLRHSVAFRVTEDEWRLLKSFAENEGLTIPRLAKRCLFDVAKVKLQTVERRSYGQIRR